jgi:antitoxin component of RelBE/YafQ-DinJ toxin-antitoxin module
MPDKQMVSAKIAPRTKERLDNYKEEQGVSRSQAIDIMLKQGLDVEESDMRLVPVKTDGGTKIENQIGETQDQLEEVEKTVDELKDGLEDDISQNNLSYLLLTAGLVYIIIQTSFSVPSSLTIPVGIGLIGGLLYVNLLR